MQCIIHNVMKKQVVWRKKPAFCEQVGDGEVICNDHKLLLVMQEVLYCNALHYILYCMI